MLSLCVWRFVVDQKEKYWANHSWRWASGESMAESFVSGGLQGGGAKSKANRRRNKKKIKDRREINQSRGQRLCFTKGKNWITHWVNESGSSSSDFLQCDYWTKHRSESQRDSQKLPRAFNDTYGWFMKRALKQNGRWRLKARGPRWQGYLHKHPQGGSKWKSIKLWMFRMRHFNCSVTESTS